MTETIKVRGGNSLNGSVTPVPNKNAILKVIPAAILTNETITYHNIPNTTDVKKLLEIMKLLGALIDDTDYNNLTINCKNVTSHCVDFNLGNQLRASILLAGPLLVRFGKAEIPTPGGCVLGMRSIMAHIDAFQKAGVNVEMNEGYAKFTAPKTLNSTYDIWQSETSVTGTENLSMYAAGTDSEFTIVNSASEPHTKQLLEMLQSMGADIQGIGSNKLVIKGKTSLTGTTFTPDPDFVDIGGLIVAAAVTKGRIKIINANKRYITGGLIQMFQKFNIGIRPDGNDLLIDGTGKLFIDKVYSGFPMAGENLPKLKPEPWPGFPVDLIPVMVTLACKTEGSLLVQNWMYETGLDFIKELNAMGADIFMADPQRVIVNGPIKFRGGRITAPGIIQACKAIFLASLADDVETTISGVEILKRRYPDVFNVYKSLGANIEGPVETSN